MAISLPYEPGEEFECALRQARRAGGRTQFLVYTSSHFLVVADDPQQALEWLDGDLDLKARSFGHTRAVALPDGRDTASLRACGEGAWQATYSAYPLGGLWSPAAWPARTAVCRLAPVLSPPARVAG